MQAVLLAAQQVKTAAVPPWVDSWSKTTSLKRPLEAVAAAQKIMSLSARDFQSIVESKKDAKRDYAIKAYAKAGHVKPLIAAIAKQHGVSSIRAATCCARFLLVNGHVF